MVLNAAKQTLYLLFYLVIGYALNRAKVLDKERAKGISNLLVYVMTPTLIITKMQVPRTPQLVRDIIYAGLLIIILYTVSIFLCKVCFRKENEYNLLAKFGSIYSNTGYMGVPVVEAVLGSGAVFYLSILIALFNVYAFTHGTMVMKRKTDRLNWKKIAFSPAILAVILGIILFLSNISLPSVIYTPLELISSCMTPCAMILAGNSLATTNLRAGNAWKYVGKSMAFRLIIIPVIATLILAFIPGNIMVKMAILIGFSCPSATLTVAFALLYDRDDGMASQIMSFSTIASIATIPVMVWFGNLLIH